MTKRDFLVQSPSTNLIRFIENYIQCDEFEILPLAGDASTRKYFRIISGSDSWVLMSWESFSEPGKFPFLNVQSHFAAHGVKVPEVVAMDPDQGLILLEDLGDLTLERKFWENQNQRHTMPYYELAIEELIKIHYPATDKKNPNCSAFQVQFDTEKFMWEMNYGKKNLIESLCKINLSDEHNKDLEKCFLDICGTLDKQPKRVSHRDYHSRNLMIKLGQMRVIDFQDARLGPIQYDLVSLAYDSYVNLGPDRIDEIFSYYIEKANPHLSEKIDLDHFEEIMKIQLLQRCFKACGSFASFFVLREDSRYLKYIRPTLQRVAKCLEELNTYPEFQKILTDHGLLDRKFDEVCGP